MVRNVFVATIGSKIPDKQAGRVFAFGNAFVGPVLAVLRLNQVAIRPSRICIAHHNVCGYELTAGKFNAARLAAFNADAGHRAVVVNFDAAFIQQFDQFANNGTRTTHGRVNPPATL